MIDRPIRRISDLECYLVGGAVRDQMLGIERGDKDWVVVGATEESMLALGFLRVGRDFPVFLHPETHEEYALARTERKIGKGYKGFDVDTSQTVTLEQDLYRRDLTVNAMALDADGSLIDPFGGKRDLENGLLRHVSPHFSEDPLRVLRVARFAARFHSKGFVVDETTLALMQELAMSGELDYLTAERVLQEVLSALSEDHPSIFFMVLQACSALATLFPEIHPLFERDSGEVSPLSKLDAAARMTHDVEFRFAMLAYLVNRCRTQTDAEAANAASVRRLCKRLKTSRNQQSLAVRTSMFAERIMTLQETPAKETVAMILALNGLRDQKGFSQFMDASSVVLTAMHEDEFKVRQAVELIGECRNCMHETDMKDLVKLFEGDQLRDQVRKAYIESVTRCLEKSAAIRSSE